MENAGKQSRNIGGRKEPSIDPVTAQGILTSVNQKTKYASKLWEQRWGFYRGENVRRVREEEAQKLGMTLEEYREGIRSLNCQVETKKYPVEVDPSPKPIPATTSAMIGRRVKCPLERYGRAVRTARDFPIRPPLPPGQVYDPYKQTMIFLGSVDGDPISYKLPPSRCEVTDEMWAEPRQLAVAAFSQETLEKAMRSH